MSRAVLMMQCAEELFPRKLPPVCCATHNNMFESIFGSLQHHFSYASMSKIDYFVKQPHHTEARFQF